MVPPCVVPPHVVPLCVVPLCVSVFQLGGGGEVLPAGHGQGGSTTTCSTTMCSTTMCLLCFSWAEAERYFLQAMDKVAVPPRVVPLCVVPPCVVPPCVVPLCM